MAKFHLGVAAAFVTIFVVLAHVATAHRTIITTVTVDENGRGESEECKTQMGSRPVQCEMLLRERARSPGQGMMHLTQCCSEMQQVDESCRCQMLEQIMRESREEMEGQKMEKVMDVAKVLPQMCGMKPKYCEFSMPRI